MKNQNWILFALICTTLVGCKQWQDASGYDNPVFSETGDKVAMVFQTFEEKDKFSYIAKQNFYTQVVLVDDAGNKEVISELMEGDVADFFYQEDEGYVILGRISELQEDEAGNDVGWVQYDRIGLNGTLTPLGGATGVIMLSCDGGTSKMSTTLPRRYIPNPAGDVIAAIESESTCSSREQSLTFLDAQTLAVINGPIALDEGANPEPSLGMPWSTQDMAWTEDGAFAVASWADSAGLDSLNAKVYTVGENTVAEEVMHFSCFSVPTASSGQGIHGQEVYVNEDTGVLSFSDHYDAYGFGCNE